MAGNKKKTKPKVPHVAMHLPLDPTDLCTRCTAIWAAVKADTAHFANPYPPAIEVEPDLAELATAIQAAAGGAPIAMAALYVAADKVRGTFQRLGGYVESVLRAGPIEDAPAILGNVLMYMSNVGQRPSKPALEVRDGATSGVAKLIALAVASAVAYYWEVSLDQATWSVGTQSAQAHGTLTGLTPGKLYYFRFRALLRDNSMTSYSQVVSFMVR